MTDITDLKARIAAGETGQDIDLMVHRAVTGDPSWVKMPLCIRRSFLHPHGKVVPDHWEQADGRTSSPIDYTTSLDVAAGLLPEGWVWESHEWRKGPQHDFWIFTVLHNATGQRVSDHAPTEIAARLLCALEAIEISRSQSADGDQQTGLSLTGDQQ